MFRVDHAAFQDVQFIPTSPCEGVLKNCKGVSNFTSIPFDYLFAVFTFKRLLRFKLTEVKLTEPIRLVQCLYWLK